MKTNKFKIKNIPTLLAFFLIILGFFGGIFLLNKNKSINSRASGESSPHNIKITNINSSSFTVSWTTQSATTGQITYKNTEQTEKFAKDKRDENKAILGKYLLHFVVVKNLSPDTNYSFSIISGDKTYGEEGHPFSVRTAAFRNSTDSDIAQGRVVTKEGQSAEEVIVYLSLPNTIVQSTLTDNQGNWMLPLSNAYAVDLQNLSNYDRNAQIEEIVVQGDDKTSLVTLTTGNDNPAPEIILGENQNFVGQELLTPNRQSQLSQTSNEGFKNSSIDQNLSISFPTENENVNSLRPEFFGNGPKNKSLEILIESGQIISGKTTVDTTGKWKYSSKENLAPGKHKLTVSYVDEDGFTKKIERNFVVLATSDSGLPSFTATPSGEITETPSPTMKLSPTKTITTLPTKTTSPVPSSMPTGIPTISVLPPTPTSVSLVPTTVQKITAVPTEKPPISGNRIPTYLFFILGSVSILFGIAILL